MGHPFLADTVDFGDFLLSMVMVIIAFVICLVATMLMVWFERKVVSRLQNRIGPNVAGPWGLFQTLADGIKLFFKEDIIPTRSDRFVFQLAPYLSLVPAFLTFTLVPIAGDFSGGDPDRGLAPGTGSSTVFGREFYWQVADVPVGILFFLAMSSLGIYGIMLAGWSSGSKYPLLGSIRASAQAISYEAALGLSLAAVLLVAGSLSTHEIVLNQNGGLRTWHVLVTGFVPFVVFLIAGTAELNRPPFDLVEAEQELVGGFHTEYSSIRFALFFLAEFMNTVTMGAIIVTLFFGGPAPLFNFPFIDFPRAWWMGFIFFFGKLLVFLFIFVWFRATLPRLRYDQLMDLGWKVLIPLSLGWLLILGGLQIARDGNIGVISPQEGDGGFFGSFFGDILLVIVVGAAGLAIAAGLLRKAVANARTERLTDAGLVSVPNTDLTLDDGTTHDGTTHNGTAHDSSADHEAGAH